jgi:hypothetical protein
MGVDTIHRGDYPVISGADYEPSESPKNEAESDRCLKTDTKSGTPDFGGNRTTQSDRAINENSNLATCSRVGGPMANGTVGAAI